MAVAVKISTTYDAIRDQLNNIFNEKQRIPNPYDLESNQLVAKEYYGFRIGPGNQETLEHCTYSINREVTVIILSKFVRNEAKSDGFDSASKDILESSNKVFNLFLKSEELGEYDIIEKIDLSSASGIQSLKNNDESYLYTEIVFNILISEQYT